MMLQLNKSKIIKTNKLIKTKGLLQPSVYIILIIIRITSKCLFNYVTVLTIRTVSIIILLQDVVQSFDYFQINKKQKDKTDIIYSQSDLNYIILC